MSWAEGVYVLWAFVALLALGCWLAAVKGWHLGTVRVVHPAVYVRRILGVSSWVRVGTVVVWIWLGVHLFAR